MTAAGLEYPVRCRTGSSESDEARGLAERAVRASLDTSVLVPLFVPELQSDPVRSWFASRTRDTLAISDWTMTEFASEMGIKVREKTLQPEQARMACALMDKLAADSLMVFTPTRGDFSRAAEHPGHHALGLRAGYALHLAIAENVGAKYFHTLDRRLIAAARRRPIKTVSPI